MLKTFKPGLLLTFCVSYLIMVVYSVIGSRLIEIDNSYQENTNIKNYFITFLFFNFIETVIAQTFVYELFRAFKIEKKLLLMYVFSVLLFAFLHYNFSSDHPMSFVVVMILPGLILMYHYTRFMEKSLLAAIFYTALMHFLSNLTIYYIGN